MNFTKHLFSIGYANISNSNNEPSSFKSVPYLLLFILVNDTSIPIQLAFIPSLKQSS